MVKKILLLIVIAVAMVVVIVNPLSVMNKVMAAAALMVGAIAVLQMNTDKDDDQS